MAPQCSLSAGLATAAHAKASASPSAEGIGLGPWRLAELLADGEWSQVYAAYPSRAPGGHSHSNWAPMGRAGPPDGVARQAGSRPRAGAPYAIKLLAESQAENALAVACLQREGVVARQVQHSRLIHVLDVHLDAPPYYLVMPRLAGTSLDRAATQRQLSVTMSLCVVRQVAEALSALHDRGWIHADVKPGNIMVSPAGHATLLDLGFARRAEEACDRVRRPLWGALAYLAPDAFTSA